MSDPGIEVVPLRESSLSNRQYRIAIVHTRSNAPIVKALLAGAISKLKQVGMPESDIVVRSVPSSFELPVAVSKMIEISQGLSTITAPSYCDGIRPFSAVIAIGVLIKGQTTRFEYTFDAVSQGLMRIQLDTGVPVIFGVLTALTEDQALSQAGIGKGDDKGHNLGEDWGLVAVEMAGGQTDGRERII